MPDADRPLEGRTVVITRPRDLAASLVEQLEAAGAVPIVMPLIELVDVASDAEIAAAVASLTVGDWVIATSVGAARRVAPHLGSTEASVAAVGSTTAANLPRTDLVAAEQSAAGLVSVFPAGIGSALVVQAEEGAPTMVDGLTELGWQVSQVITHRSSRLVPSAAQQMAVLAADAVVFTSGTQADAWVDIFGTSTPLTVVTIGPQTTMKTQRSGIKVQVTATDHSVAGIVAALTDFFGQASLDR